VDRAEKREVVTALHDAVAMYQPGRVVVERILQLDRAIRLHGGLAGEDLAVLALDLAQALGASHLVTALRTPGHAGAADSALAFADDRNAAGLGGLEHGLAGRDTHAALRAPQVSHRHDVFHPAIPTTGKCVRRIGRWPLGDYHPIRGSEGLVGVAATVPGLRARGGAPSTSGIPDFVRATRSPDHPISC